MSSAPQIVEFSPRWSRSATSDSRYRRREPKRDEESRLSGEQWSLTRPEKGGFFKTCLRVISILGVSVFFGLRAALAVLFFRDVRQRTAWRAVLLRRVFETLGGAFIKVGQQLSL